MQSPRGLRDELCCLSTLQLLLLSAPPAQPKPQEPFMGSTAEGLTELSPLFVPCSSFPRPRCRSSHKAPSPRARSFIAQRSRLGRRGQLQEGGMSCLSTQVLYLWAVKDSGRALAGSFRGLQKAWSLLLSVCLQGTCTSSCRCHRPSSLGTEHLQSNLTLTWPGPSRFPPGFI